MNQNETVGARIRSARTARRMTLKQLSEQSGLSVGFLSQLERGMSSVAIDTLTELSRILGISLSSFFESAGQSEPDPVLHSYDLPFDTVSPQIIQHVLSRDTQAFDMLPRMFTLLPQPESDEPMEMYVHEGEEFIYVLEGIVDVALDGRRYTLYPGDSMQIRSAAPHNWANVSGRTARILQVNVPNPLRSQT
ncbi:MAG: cupin domain-containing protein [Candidatus Fimadaptatus sp.]|jgi:transcriptional regulator with XRE-family HTH domain